MAANDFTAGLAAICERRLDRDYVAVDERNNEAGRLFSGPIRGISPTRLSRPRRSTVCVHFSEAH
jgi:hypothetical protein